MNARWQGLEREWGTLNKNTTQLFQPLIMFFFSQEEEGDGGDDLTKSKDNQPTICRPAFYALSAAKKADGLTGEFEGSLRCSKNFNWNFQRFQRIFPKVLKEISKDFKWNFQRFRRKLPKILKETSKDLEGYFQRFWRKFPKILKEISKDFKGNLQRLKRIFHFPSLAQTAKAGGLFDQRWNGTTNVKEQPTLLFLLAKKSGDLWRCSGWCWAQGRWGSMLTLWKRWQPHISSSSLSQFCLQNK